MLASIDRRCWSGYITNCSVRPSPDVLYFIALHPRLIDNLSKHIHYYPSTKVFPLQPFFTFFTFSFTKRLPLLRLLQPILLESDRIDIDKARCLVYIVSQVILLKEQGLDGRECRSGNAHQPARSPSTNPLTLPPCHRASPSSSSAQARRRSLCNSEVGLRRSVCRNQDVSALVVNHVMRRP